MSHECICFDYSFSERAAHSTVIACVNTILTALNEMERICGEAKESDVLLRSITAIVGKCNEMKEVLMERCKEKENGLSRLSMGTFSICDKGEECATPKFSYKEKEWEERNCEDECSCMTQQVMNMECRTDCSSGTVSGNDSVVMDCVSMKELLRNVKEMQDKGIITKMQKQFLKEKIISKEINFYAYILSQYESQSFNSSSNSNDLTRMIRKYLKQFRIN